MQAGYARISRDPRTAQPAAAGDRRLVVAWTEAERRSCPASSLRRTPTASTMCVGSRRGTRRARAATSRRARSAPCWSRASTSSIPGRRRSPMCCRPWRTAARSGARREVDGRQLRRCGLDPATSTGRSRRASSSMPPAFTATWSRPSPAHRRSPSGRAKVSSSSSTSRPTRLVESIDPAGADRAHQGRRGAPHRLRQCARRPDGRGLRRTATTPASTRAALRSLIDKAVRAGARVGAATTVTAVYAGLRPATQFKDYQIAALPDRNWITVGGIRSTGLTGSLGIAQHVARTLRAAFRRTARRCVQPHVDAGAQPRASTARAPGSSRLPARSSATASW